ncbi:VOC family protein [Subtercola boreus]|uniref:Glyoxalase n=1 Tax=Subtercola boreus TaxID=120213 RepID=A0A3E0WFJ2_9MICO|nr:VOC family protein [Subtercola boreus]RFA22387.1 glyoxalase [Subtercola boreus]RFA22449.1 glyoxalase [Subtercola boreus]RFA28464.1 glyoxalase [Subtercola boreus]
MTLKWASIIVDSHDIAAQGRWWAETLGWVVQYESDDEVEIAPAPTAQTQGAADGAPFTLGYTGPTIEFVPVPEGKTVKNRLHIDLAPRAGDDQAAEVERLLARGASRSSIGQGPDETWVVLADPEGNEFCVLSPRD